MEIRVPDRLSVSKVVSLEQTRGTRGAGRRTVWVTFNPIMTTLHSASTTTCAASGSNNTLNSAVGLLFPYTPAAPPMKTISPIPFPGPMRDGKERMKRAERDDEPVTTSVKSTPLLLHSSTAFRIPWTASPGSVVEGTNAWTAGSAESGKPTTPPRPSEPWMSGSWRAGRRNGLAQPGWTTSGELREEEEAVSPDA